MLSGQADLYWMRRALALARRGLGTTAPNPLVGAIVLDSAGKPAGSGFHRMAGEAHAEAAALDQAGEKARGGTLYVTLEPCAHTGRTPPCIGRILQSGIRRIVVAMQDPNPQVNGKGIAALQASGIEVSVGCLSEIAEMVNAPFRTWILEKRPRITAKTAVTLDGKIGVRGERLQLSGPVAERRTMKLRAESGAILVGAGTLLADDPLLTVRGKYKDRTPIRAVADGNLRTPETAKLFSTPGGPVWIFCHEQHADTPKAAALRKKGAKVIPVPADREGKLSVFHIVRVFGEAGVTALLVEGGSVLLSSFVHEGLLDRWVFYLVPRMLGDRLDGRETVPLSPGGPFPLKFHSAIRRGADWVVVATPEKA